MLGVLVTFRYGNQFNEAQVRQIAEEAQGRFKGMPGLRSKAFTVDAAKREAVNFYVWDFRECGAGVLHACAIGARCWPVRGTAEHSVRASSSSSRERLHALMGIIHGALTII